MAVPVISIFSDSSEESVGSHVPQVILFGTIPTSVYVISVVPAEVPIAPANPIVASEDSLPIASELPLVSPFLCFDDSKADSESEPAKQRRERHESLAPSSDFPLAPIVAPPMIRRRPAILVQPDFTSDSSSSGSSSDSSSDISSSSSLDSLSDSSSVHSSGCDASGQYHSGPSTRVASSRLADTSVRT
nr:hypothetical protein [Tanacetum cinerariifolium]